MFTSIQGKQKPRGHTTKHQIQVTTLSSKHLLEVAHRSLALVVE
ncbi:hypothetical protein Leryth_014464 [Lithospermum erythrorhizon]|nr:hypothetical protein Leryth_014464 [Lithospermum erythrorhizon]